MVTKKSAAKKSASTKTTKAEKTIASAEKKVDQVVSAATKKAKAKVSAKMRSNATKIAAKAERMANDVEHVGQEIEEVTESMLPGNRGSVSQFTAQRSQHVSRLFIFRFLWVILQGPIICIRSIRYFIISIVHYIYMFLLGERNKHLRQKQTRYRRHVITWKAYLSAITDKRPEIIVD